MYMSNAFNHLLTMQAKAARDKAAQAVDEAARALKESAEEAKDYIQGKSEQSAPSHKGPEQ